MLAAMYTPPQPRKASSNLQPLRLMQQIKGAAVPTGQVFDQAHNKAIIGLSLNYQRRYLALAESLISLKPPLPAYQVVAYRIAF